MKMFLLPRFILVCSIIGSFGFENPPINVVSHVNGDWFLFGDSRSDCSHASTLNPPTYAYMDLDSALCNSGKVSAKSNKSLFKSLHFSDFYNYTGEGHQIIFYEGVNFSPSHGYKCNSIGDNAVWMQNKLHFYLQLYQRMAVYRSLTFIPVPYNYSGAAKASKFCTGSKLILDNPVFIAREAGITDYYYKSEADFVLAGCDEYIVPLCIFKGKFLSNKVLYDDSQYYFNKDSGVVYGMNSTLNITTGVDLSCEYLILPSGNYTTISYELFLTIPSMAVCLSKTKSFTPVQVVDSRWHSDRASDNMTALACQLPYCYFRTTNSDYNGVHDVNHGDAGFTSILSGLLYDSPCIAQQGVFKYDNVSSVWPLYSYGKCPTAANIVITDVPICVYDPLPVILLGILLGIAVIIIVVLLLYFMVDNGTRLHDA